MERQSLDDIFIKNREIIVPFFQRNYVWGRDENGNYDTGNWERLLNDIKAINDGKKETHFIGVLILKRLPKNIGRVDSIWQLVDGQQRITTIILFFKALCEINRLKDEFKSTFFNYNKEITLKHNHIDKEIFEKIVNDELDEKIRKKYEEKDSLILKCYDYFISNDTLKDINFENVINKIKFVTINIEDDEDEQEIFDSINSLGVDLTPSQLLKNYIFNEKDLKFYNETWRKTFEDDDNSEYWNRFIFDNRINLDYLLYSFLVIKNINNNEYIRIGTLFNQYKKYIEQENILIDANKKQDFIKELVGYAELYKENIGKNLTDIDIYINRINIIIFNLEVSPLIPYLLYILKNSQEKRQIIEYLEKYIIRQNICDISTKNYNNIFIDLIKKNISTLSKVRDYFTDKNGQYLISDDNKIISNIKKKFNNKDAKVILYLLEMYLRDEKKDIENLKNISEMQLEHIMPQKWEQNWMYNLPINNGKSIEENKQKRYSAIYNLGNLTILTGSLNNELKNADWKTKRDGIEATGRKKKRNGLKDYANNLKVFSIYDNIGKEINDWDEKMIDKRTKWLFDKILEIWSI